MVTDETPCLGYQKGWNNKDLPVVRDGLLINPELFDKVEGHPDFYVQDLIWLSSNRTK